MHLEGAGPLPKSPQIDPYLQSYTAAACYRELTAAQLTILFDIITDGNPTGGV